MAKKIDKDGCSRTWSRKYLMRLSYEIASKEMPLWEDSDLNEYHERGWRKLPPLTDGNDPDEEAIAFMQLILEWSASGFNNEIYFGNKLHHIEWFDAMQFARQTLSEIPNSKVDTYKLAAKLFNEQLLKDQSHGDRLTEAPISWEGLRRALEREDDKKALLSNSE